MAIHKEITEKELYIYMNGKLLLKKWLNQGRSVVFDVMPYDKHTLVSITENDDKIQIKRN